MGIFENISLPTGIGVNTNHEQVASYGGCQHRMRDPGPQATPPATAVSIVLTSRLSPMRQSRLVQAVWHHTPGTYASVFCTGTTLYGAAYAWYCRINIRFGIEEPREHVSVNWHQAKYQLWTNWFICWMPASNAGPRVTGNSAIHSCVLCLNFNSDT